MPLARRYLQVLLAFARHHPHIGYCQGLNFIGGLLLLHGDEAGAFGLLSVLCNRLLVDFYTPELKGLHRAQVHVSDWSRVGRQQCSLPGFCTSLERAAADAPSLCGALGVQASLLSLLHTSLPTLHDKLHADGVPVREQTTHWLLCLFVDALPMQLVLRLWDIFFSDGLPVLLHASVSLFALHEASALPCRFAAGSAHHAAWQLLRARASRDTRFS